MFQPVSVYMCECVYVYVCVCAQVFISIHRKDISWLNKTINANARVQIRNGMLWKNLCIKGLCLRIKDNQKRTFKLATVQKRVN